MTSWERMAYKAAAPEAVLADLGACVVAASSSSTSRQVPSCV